MQTELIIATAFTGVAAVTDLRNRKIPNWLTLTCFCTGIAYHGRTLLATGPWPLLGAIEGAALTFAILLTLWLIDGAGAGDVKLGTSVGVWIPTREVLYVLLISFCICVVWRRLSGQKTVHQLKTFPTSIMQTPDETAATYRIPYAVPLAASLMIQLAISGS